MNPEQLLEQLEPLRAPSTIGFFPLAPGWWLVVALVSIAIGLLIFFALRRFKRAAYRRQGLQWLNELETQSADIQMLSRALKATAVKVYDPSGVAGLSGDDWPSFLRRTCTKLDEKALSILSQVHHAEPEHPTSADWHHARLWMKQHEVPRA